MSLINIEYIFSVGFRCTSPEALKSVGLRPFSGPFDYMFIDIETVFKLMVRNMDNFLSNIVVFNKSKNSVYDLNVFNVLTKNDIGYMCDNYNTMDLRINSNYLDKQLSNNLYDWNAICIFHHHDISKPSIYDSFQRRVERFNYAIRNHSNKTCLFYITKILHITNLIEYMQEFIRMKNKYNIHTYITIILCCDNYNSDHYFSDNVLFIIKKVDPYNIQIKTGTDNNLCYNYEFGLMKQYFHFKLVEKDNVLRNQ